MNDRLARSSHDRSMPRAFFLRVAATVFLLCCLIATMIAFLLPEHYASDSIVFFKYISDYRDQPDMTQQAARREMADQAFQTELAMFTAENVLGPVIDELDLKIAWGKKYANGVPLKTSEAVEMLRARVFVSKVRDESVIKVRVVSDDKNEPTIIAKSLINHYKASWLKFHWAVSEDETVENQINALSESISVSKGKTAALREQFHISNNATRPQSPHEQQYFLDAKRELEEQELAYQKLTHEFNEKLTARATAPGHSMELWVIQSPTPSHSTLNKPRIIFYGAIFGIFLGLSAGGVAAMLAARREKFTPQNVTVA